MIWVWIILSLAATAFLLRDKNIAPHNYLWAFIPIDKYGYNIMGFTFKPIYIFSILLILYSVIRKNFKVKLSASIICPTFSLCILVVLAALFRGNASLLSDIKTYGILFLTFILATCSLSLIEGRDDLRQIKDVMIATAVGYGIVFLLLYFLVNLGVNLPAVRDSGVWNDSIVNTFKSVVNGQVSESYRLRGFYIDPNSSTVFFLVGFASLLGDWLKNGKPVKNTIYSLIIAANIVLTRSRSGLVVLCLIIAINIFRLMFAKTQSRRKIIFIASALMVLFIVFVVFVYSSRAFSYVYDRLISGYVNRSGLNDEMGRFSIWRDALSTLNSDNWFCGHGIGSLPSLTDSSRDAHNTYIEVFCSSGVIVGAAYILCFAYPLLFALKRRIVDERNAYYISNFAIAYLSICLMLSTISNIASVYLIYLACLLYIIPGRLENEEIKNLNVSVQGA